MLMGAEPVRSILHLSYPCDIPSYQQPFLVWRITLCVSVWPEFPEHSRRHTTMDVGKSSSSSLSKVPFFFLLASEPGNFGRKEYHSQTELDRRLAVCQAGLGRIPVCYGREKRKTIHFVLDSTNSAKFHLFPSALCKCDNGAGWRTCRQLNGKAHLPESTISGALIICCALREKATSLSWKRQLAPTANSCSLCGNLVIYSHLGRYDWMALCVWSRQEWESCIGFCLQAREILS